MEIWKEFRFEAAHKLDQMPDGHQCKRLHGHSYRFRVWFRGHPEQPFGFCAGLDYADIAKVVNEEVVNKLDHRYINELTGLEIGITTAENLAMWIYRVIVKRLPACCRVELFETPTTGIIYEGEWR